MTALAGVRRRLQSRDVLAGATLASGAGGLALAAGLVFGVPAAWTRDAVAFAWAIALAAAWARARARWTPPEVAVAIERAAGCLDNLVVTAAELGAQPCAVRSDIRDEVVRQASARLDAIDVRRAVPLAREGWTAVAVSAALFVAAFAAPSRMVGRGPSDGRESRPAAPIPAEGRVKVTATPPPYTGRPASIVHDPVDVRVLAGTSVRAEVTAPPSIQTFVADRTRILVLPVAAGGRDAPDERLLPVIVEPDTPPVVRITAPGRDLVLSDPRAVVEMAIEVDDDVGVGAAALAFTRVSGSGEGHSFVEGTWPIVVTERGATRWRAHARVRLADLGLTAGDTLVYRATARDRRPGADPSSSPSYVIQVGAGAVAAAGGSAIPEERDRAALSQQMVILRTERLRRERARLGREDLLVRARGLAVEQRMVKAEFVFMTGGEVQDEVEEATHAHEIAEGRLQNAGQTELLAAVRDMSRAEARLNAADLDRALVFERAALRALQRAFDRRRYFLRTLPERARIDPERRLTGDVRDAHPGERPARTQASAPETEAIRRALAAIEALVAGSPDAGIAAVAAIVARVDPDDEDLRGIAARIATATDERSRRAAAGDASLRLAGRLRDRVGAAPRDLGAPPW